VKKPLVKVEHIDETAYLMASSVNAARLIEGVEQVRPAVRYSDGNNELNRRDAETQSVNEVTEAVIGAAIEVHRALGPGLLENAYELCLARELSLRRVAHIRQFPVPLIYKGVELECGYVIDLLVADKVIVELKTVDKLLPIHEAQLLTYLKLTNLKVGLLINFKERTLLQGLKRIVNNLQ